MNNGRLTLCPFYITEKDKAITCEDVKRLWDSKKQKYEWMDQYCDAHWEECKYAINLNNAYKKGVVELAKEKSQRNELRSVTSKLNKAEKSLEAKEQEIKRLRKIKDKWEQGYLRKAQELRDEEHNNEIMAKYLADLTIAFEARLCYLIHEYVPEQSIKEADVENWIKEVEYILDGIKNEDGHVVEWQTKVRKRGPYNVESNKTN